MFSHRRFRGRILAFGGALWIVAIAASLAQSPARADIIQTNLVTDDQSVNQAKITDPNLVNPWGISSSPANPSGPMGPFWVSDNGTGVSTLYSVDPTTNATAAVPLVVTIPGDGSVTGQAFNTTSAFNGDRFLFVNEDGTISGWRGALGTNAEVLQTADPNNIYKGAALDVVNSNAYLLSANFGTGNIDVLKNDSSVPDLTGKFLDPNLPAGYAPFNIANLGGVLYVSYAVKNGKDDQPGPGNGIVSAFDANGIFLGRIGTGGSLNSPWGMAIAPGGFPFAGALLVGNFGDGRINAFSADALNPGFLGQLEYKPSNPVEIDGLWGLIVGNNGSAGSSSKLYFSAGPDDETHGLFGVLEPSGFQSVPEPSTAALALAGVGLAGGVLIRKRSGRE